MSDEQQQQQVHDNNNHTTNDDGIIPKAVIDFIFDLYDSITFSQIHIEQIKLYTVTFPELCTTYYSTTRNNNTNTNNNDNKSNNNNSTSTTTSSTSNWPSPHMIASECNGDPLFLAIYRELIHRYYFNTSSIKPTLTDRIEGYDVYKELFDEILESLESKSSSSTSNSDTFYLSPIWIFEILFEYIYQFQGYCQIKSAVYATAKKNGLLQADGTSKPTTTTTTPSDETTTTTTNTTSTSNNNNNRHANLLENLKVLENNVDAWDVSVVYTYLSRLIALGYQQSSSTTATSTTIVSSSPVNTYFTIFGCICQSRLECLLGDYTSCLSILDILYNMQTNQKITINKDDEIYTIDDIITSVTAAKVSMMYHVAISYIQLRRYYDATYTLLLIANELQHGFKTNTIKNELFNKQYDRIISLLTFILHICPSSSTKNNCHQLMNMIDDESILRAIREKQNQPGTTKIDVATNYEEWFASPKFINGSCTTTASSAGSSTSTSNTDTTTTNTSSNNNMIMISSSLYHKQQIDIFQKQMKFFIHHQKSLRSFLKLYTSIPIHKLNTFYYNNNNNNNNSNNGNNSNNNTSTSNKGIMNNETSTTTATNTNDILPILITYKSRMRQLQRILPSSWTDSTTSGITSMLCTSFINGSYDAPNTSGSGSSSSSSSAVTMPTTTTNKIATDLHYYIVNDTVIINEAEQHRPIESYLCHQIQQLYTIRNDIMKLNIQY